MIGAQFEVLSIAQQLLSVVHHVHHLLQRVFGGAFGHCVASLVGWAQGECERCVVFSVLVFQFFGAASLKKVQSRLPNPRGVVDKHAGRHMLKACRVLSIKSNLVLLK